MTTEVIVAVIGAIAVIVAALIQRERRHRAADTSSTSPGLVIGQPREGEIFEVPRSAHRPHRLPISGRVAGVSPEVLRRGDLHVEVVIRADASYPQGKASVAANGQWLLPDARFGGERHEITAFLMDTAGRELAAAHSHAFIRRI